MSGGIRLDNAFSDLILPKRNHILMFFSLKKRVLDYFVVAFLAALIAVSLTQVSAIKEEFTILGVLHSTDGNEYRPVKMPFFGGPGRFIIKFRASKPHEITIYNCGGCVKWARIDNLIAYNTRMVCERRRTNCEGLKLNGSLSYGAEYVHTLEVNVEEIKNARSSTFKLFFVETGSYFIWGLTALLSSIMLSVVFCLALSGRKLSWALRRLILVVRENKVLVLLLTLSLFAQLMLLPLSKTGDLDHWIVWTENLVNKRDFNFITLDADYAYLKNAYMNKPPGAYLYPLALLRMLFGFNYVYFQYLVKVPAVFGHLLLGYAIWAILAEKTGDRKITFLGASLYLFNPAALIQAAVLGKSDFLSLALLVFALRNLNGGRFPFYYGLSVLCKQTPLFLLPWLLVQKRMFKQVFTAGVIVLLFCLPFIAYEPLTFFERLIKTHSNKRPLFLSWMRVVSRHGIKIHTFKEFFLGSYLLALFVIAYSVKAEAYRMGALVFGMFPLFSQVVYEQYLLWALPFFLLVFLLEKRASAIVVYTMVSLTCAITYESYNPLGHLLNPLTILLNLVLLSASIILIIHSLRQAGGTGTKTP